MENCRDSVTFDAVAFALEKGHYLLKTQSSAGTIKLDNSEDTDL